MRSDVSKLTEKNDALKNQKTKQKMSRVEAIGAISNYEKKRAGKWGFSEEESRIDGNVTEK